MEYASDNDFYHIGHSLEQGDTPVIWRQWGSDDVIEQPLEGSVLRVFSSSSSDTSKGITVFGTVGGFPDSETITTNSSDGTTAVSGSKSFTEVERVTKDSTTVGRITVDANSANTTIATLPTGDTTGSVQYLKVQVFPFPTRVFPVNVLYYKDPWRLVGNNDIHELGHQFDEAIIDLTVAKLNYGQSKKEGDKFFALYKDEIKNLSKYNVDTIANWQPSLRRGLRVFSHAGHGVGHGHHGTSSRFLSFSQLGGFFGPRIHI